MNAEKFDWKARREEQRETEWQLRNRVLRFVETMLDRWENDADKFGTLEAVTKQVELVSKLGRLAVEQDGVVPQNSGVSEEFLAALLRLEETETAATAQEEA